MSFKSKIFLLKFSLLGCCVVLLAIIFNSVLQEKENSANIVPNLDKVDVEINKESHQKNHMPIENSEVIVDKFTFRSKTKDNHPYTIKATKAMKTKSGNYTINNIVADLRLDFHPVMLSAEDGNFCEGDEMLELRDNIVANYLGGVLTTKSLIVNLAKREFFGPSKVLIHNNNISISANSFITRSDKIIEFDGDVETVYYFNN